ncbi:prepilin-type N-terminal cleavage/methylation domain-containing protein [Oxalobacteraceae bacterium]|nr:prepilin-type N-terminal cleavage/methylation domain-containing protein [Oxalobacteraceae bacterium]
MSHLSLPQRRHLPSRRQRGVALIESMVAIIILGIGLIGTVGLQARTYSALNDANMRAEATIASDNLLGIMGNDLLNLGSYAVSDAAAGAAPNPAVAEWLAQTRSYIPGALITVALLPMINNGMQVDITIRWTRKTGERQNTHQITAYFQR